MDTILIFDKNDLLFFFNPTSPSLFFAAAHFLLSLPLSLSPLSSVGSVVLRWPPDSERNERKPLVVGVVALHFW